MASNVLGYFHDVAADLNSVLFERESAIDNALIALVTKEHYLQLGPVGIGKSLLVDELCARITGAQKFKLMLNQSTVPDELFGPVDLLELADHGRYTRRRGGSITQAHIAFLDEIGRGNSVVRNALLKVILERTFDEIGMQATTVPLISLFGASNSSMADDEDLSAFDDRFLLREIIQGITDDAAFIKMITAKAQPPCALLSLDQIEKAQHEVCAVRGSREVLEKIVDLRHACSAEGISVSPRRWKKSLAITKARAWLDGETEVTPEHLTCLVHVLWRDPKERKAVERLVYAAACPIYLTALDCEDAAVDLVDHLPKESDSTYDQAIENCLMQLADAHKMLGDQISQSHAKTLDRAKKSLAKIAGLHTTVSRSLLKRLERLSLNPV